MFIAEAIVSLGIRLCGFDSLLSKTFGAEFSCFFTPSMDPFGRRELHHFGSLLD